LDEMDVKECLTDLEHQGFVRTEITCFIEKQWR
jgi:hypothetical protein